MVKIEPFPGELHRKLVDRKFTTKTGKAGCQRCRAIVLTAEQEAWLRLYYPVTENPVLLKVSGMCHSTLHRYARRWGLTKSAKGLKGIRKRQVRQIKKTCEKTGYYASIRGRQPSEATREGTRKMWQEVREGKRESPIRVMKRKNPRRYQRWLDRRAAVRKEQIRKEKLRVSYGLERKTKLKCVVMCKYTRRQVSHRHNALKYGYFLSEDQSESGGERYVIFYDDDTVRRPKFEENCIKDGFTFRYEQG